MPGPLNGRRIVEMGGIGPGPMCAMLLADLGADIIRVDRLADPGLGIGMDPACDLLKRGRPSVAIDTRNAAGRDLVLDLAARADALIEGFRPGVMERMGLGPEAVLARNPKLVYGRMTGWGQDGPLAHAAGHDIDYIALVGALGAIGGADGPPVPPLNLVGDFGGGALYLAMGLLAGMLEAERSGQGQVVDAAMTDGAASLMTLFYGLLAAGIWQDRRGVNLLDGGAPFYGVYGTADGLHVAIGPIEPKFWAGFLRDIGLEAGDLPGQYDAAAWPALHERMKALFLTHTRDEWCEALEGTDACFAPVLSLAEAPAHPHNRARGTFVEVDGIVQPAPAPRFSRTPGAISRPPPVPGADTGAALADWGVAADRIAGLREAGIIGPG